MFTAVEAVQRLERDPASLSSSELASSMRDIARLRSWLDARDGVYGAAFGGRGGPEAEGAADLEDWHRKKAGATSAEAKNRARAAKTSETLPEVQAALERGEISPVAANEIGRAASKRKNTSAVVRDQRALVARTAGKTAGQVRRVIEEWEREQDPRHEADEVTRQRRGRYVRTWTNRDGSVGLSGLFDKVTGAAIVAEIDRAARARWKASQPTKTRDPWDSEWNHLRADVVADLICGGGSDAASGRRRGTVHALVDFELLFDLLTGVDGSHRRAEHVAQTIDGVRLSPDTIRRIACDAEIIPTVLDGKNQVLNHGRAKRSVTDPQFDALIARDKGCVMCGTSPRFCQAHHTTWWSRGGRTDIEHLALVCDRHHHLCHEGGFDLFRSDDGGWRMERRGPPPPE